MPRQIVFNSEARLEFEDAVAWCNECRPGSGQELEFEVQKTLDRIIENPERFRLVGPTIPQARLKKFHRYSIYFHVERDFIGVVAIFHSSREPAQLQRHLR